MHDPTGLIQAANAALDAVLPKGSHALIAVSGGPDSLALLTIAAGWATPEKAVRFSAATVDHGLRSASKSEARSSGRIANDLGISHQILPWLGPKPSSGLQAAARAARYDLLAKEARRVGATHILTAHHADDQAETILMRLTAGSGISGLAGMQSMSTMAGLVLARPLLGRRKSELEAFCHARGIPVVEDPSNIDPRFGRSRMRGLFPLLAREGLTVERLQTLARRAGSADDALETLARRSLDLALDRRTACIIRSDWSVIAAEPAEIRLRALRLMMVESGHMTLSVKLEALERLSTAVDMAWQDRARLRRTISGLMVTLTSDGMLMISAAPPRKTDRKTR